MHDFISQPLKTSIAVLCAYRKRLMPRSALRKPVKSYTEEKASSGEETGPIHKFPLFASGQTPRAFKLPSVWKGNAA